MIIEQSAGLAKARLNHGSWLPAQISVHAGPDGIGNGMPGTSFNSEWYCPNGLLSQSERLPS